jgi:hypothetical protein
MEHLAMTHVFHEPRPGQPELATIPGMAAPMPVAGHAVTADDDAISPQASFDSVLGQGVNNVPRRWDYDWVTAPGIARAHFPGNVTIDGTLTAPSIIGSIATPIINPGPLIVANSTLPASVPAGTIIYAGGADTGPADYYIDAFGAAQSRIYGRQAPGTSAAPGSGGGTIPGKNLFQLRGQGWDTTGYVTGAQINLQALDQWTPTDHSAIISFYTTQAGGTFTERARLTDLGAFLINQIVPIGPSKLGIFNTAGPHINLDGPFASGPALMYSGQGLARIGIGLDNSPDPNDGTTSGSNFIISTFLDNGAPNAVPFVLHRATGNIILLGNLTLGPGGLLGVHDNSNAPIGAVGQYLTANLPSGAAVGLSQDTNANVTSLVLPAGDWDVWGTVGYISDPIATPTFFNAGVWLNTASATTPVDAGNGAFTLMGGVPATQFADGTRLNTGTLRVSGIANTTVFLSTNVNFTGTAVRAYGFIGARRRR